MSDWIDDAKKTDDFLLKVALDNANQHEVIIELHEPDECDECGGKFQRLVDGLCGRCRDVLLKEKFLRKQRWSE